ncbi:MAG: hypothetical protein J6I45_12555 [Clostridia bacterium]|nr:hypothetical protein [Clostridia bacterium]
MKFTKMTAVVLAMLTVLLSMSLTVSAEEPTVYVTIADDKGELALAYKAVVVDTDYDGDAKFTIYDALMKAHDDAYNGGAAAGFGAVSTDYGLSMTKLWGVENGGSYGYTVNNASAMSLVDGIKDGDTIYAYCYTDLTTWSDTYCYFDQNTAWNASGELTLTLSANGYDATWAPVVNPVADAVIYVNGTATAYKTDANGQVTIKVDGNDTYQISAKKEGMVMVPPLCIYTVGDAAPQTGDMTAVVSVAVAAIALAGITFVSKRHAK